MNQWKHNALFALCSICALSIRKTLSFTPTASLPGRCRTSSSSFFSMPSIQFIQNAQYDNIQTAVRRRQILQSAAANNNDNNFHQPSPSSKLTRLETEFNTMMDHFASYTPRDMQSIHNTRTRALFEGVSAGAKEPAVRRAFTILFEDMVPIRVAGRMIYRHLTTVMDESLNRRKKEDESILLGTKLNIQDIDEGRKAFMAIHDDEDENEYEGELTMDQMVESGVVETAVSLLGHDDFSHFMKHMEYDDNGRVNFERFMHGLQKCADSSSAPECDVSHILSELASKMEPYETRRLSSSLTQRKQKHSEKYEHMLESFHEWEENFELGKSRRDEILRGCFVGANNDHVVKALKIVYMDYAALRVAGDLIFKLMSKLIGSKKKKKMMTTTKIMKEKSKVDMGL